MENEDVGILVVDDELVVRDSLYNWFREDGYEVDTAEDAKEALKKLQRRPWDIVLLDIKMPGMDGMELQKRIKEIDPNIIVIMITAYASVDTAVQALKEGAFDYITKPFDPDDMGHLIRNAVAQRRLTTENIQLRQKIDELSRFDEIIGESPSMNRVFELIDTVAQSDATVVIHGESGTGKELVARAIHSNSPRRYFPIIPVNCGALPEGILESEIFGHEKGAFTGAQYRRKGKLEMADGGTLFLDEIGNISMKTLMDLLRVLETKKFTRLGGSQEITVDFRVICATNQNLEKMVEENTFREDLYYRINVFSIFLPPLRERRSDVPLLAKHFVQKYALAMNKQVNEISPDAMDLLVRYDWRGNVRELENAIERAMVVGKPPRIVAEDLPFQLSAKRSIPSADSLEEIEKAHIRNILERTAWNISRAAEILKIERVTLYNRIKKYGLRR
ncbi:Fis family transcriptional regulator [candidate division TA06 bacterium DG_24]|uniref:Fis family transcriptional regulator n=1 Tax=candidate division TA06 bacterium DG_24 TaxID=1703770 RepID=A0A0S7WP50_UNCT6|nr:MAG: Fis family transcriptional regulator [candidate division TA06 bacterium DG_24]